MPIIRERLRSNGQNLSLKIGFDSNDDFLGSQQEVDRLTEFTAIDLVNSVVDVEERKFKLNPVVDTSTLSFNFYNANSDIINNPTATEIYFNPLSITNLAGNNVIGQIFSITFKYTIDASCDNAGSPSDPNSATTELMFSKDNGATWATADTVTASVVGGSDQSDSQTKTGTYTLTNVSDVTLVKIDGSNFECSSGALGKSGGVVVTIQSATSNIGLVNVICNDTYSINCSGENQSCVGIITPPIVPVFSFINAGFSQSEIDNNTSTMLNSFFILDFYNTYDINTQTKLFTTYLTKIGNKSQYTINASSNNQLYNLYVPVSYIEQQTGTTVNGYAKFIFYNAKYGKATLFYNQDNVSLMTSEKMYFKIKLNLINNTWEYIGTSTPNMNAKQLTNSTQYNNRVNNTITNIDNIRQIYPSGSTYQYTGNTYTVI